MPNCETEFLEMIRCITEKGKLDKKDGISLWEFLKQNENELSKWPFSVLIERYKEHLDDDKLYSNERANLFYIIKLLNIYNSERVELGNIVSNDPICIYQSSFCFTGTFLYGIRQRCVELLEENGGRYTDRVGEFLDYLVVGTFPQPNWKYKDFGTKVETAVALNSSERASIRIITEEQFYEHIALGIDDTKNRPTHSVKDIYLDDFDDSLIEIWSGNIDIEFQYVDRYSEPPCFTDRKLHLSKILRKPYRNTGDFYFSGITDDGERTFHFASITGKIRICNTENAFDLNDFLNFIGIYDAYDMSMFVKSKIRGE